MTTLGDILAIARKSSSTFQNWLQASDPGLAERVSATASSSGLSPTGYVRTAIADFSRFASEEDWATLVSSIRDAEDPGTTCLLAMIDWRLSARTCEAHLNAGPVQANGAPDDRSFSEHA